MKRTTILLVPLFLLGSATTAVTDDAKPNTCPFTDELHGWQDVDDYTAIIEVGAARYKLIFIDACREMHDATAARFISRPGICVSAGDRMVFKPRMGIEGACVIKSVEKVAPPPAASH